MLPQRQYPAPNIGSATQFDFPTQEPIYLNPKKPRKNIPLQNVGLHLFENGKDKYGLSFRPYDGAKPITFTQPQGLYGVVQSLLPMLEAKYAKNQIRMSFDKSGYEPNMFTGKTKSAEPQVYQRFGKVLESRLNDSHYLSNHKL